jgi:hypothetical protein
MKMHLTVLLLLVLSTFNVFSQKTHLYNITADSNESDIIYIGLDNQFIIRNNDNVQLVEPAIVASIKNNILIIRPGKVGDVKVSLKTKNGVEDFTFHAQFFPEHLFSITSFPNSKNVSKKDVIDYGKITISSKEMDRSADFYKNCSVISCNVIINDKVYSINGNTFSQEIIRAIRDANSKSAITIQNIKAYNPITKLTLKDERGFTFLLE